MTEITNEQFKIKGIHTCRVYDLSTIEAQEIDKDIKFLISRKGFFVSSYYEEKYKQLIEKLRKFLVREMVVENLIPTVGRVAIARRLIGDTTYTGTVNYGALGSSSTIPTNSDTQLGTEVFRKAPAVSSYISNTVFIDFYFSTTDTNGTYNEWGTFIDGTASANSGQMFTHALTGGWSKLATESLTITTQYTLN